MAASLPSRLTSTQFGVLFHRLLHGVAHVLPGGRIDHDQHVLQRAAGRFIPGPTGEPLGHRIQERDLTVRIRAHHRIADGIQGDLGTLLFFVERLHVSRALDHAAQHLRQQIRIQPVFQ
jgi:hypothetical protein